MPHMPLVITLALSQGVSICDVEATIAGELMLMRQTGVGGAVLEERAKADLPEEFATPLIARILAAEAGTDAEARELVAFHFAADIHAECETRSAARD